MKFAVPVANGKLNMHFGHCEAFAMFEVNNERTIISEEEIKAPPHEPGLLPRWLGEKGVTTVIAGGMGNRAQQLFANQNIKVITGAPSISASELVTQYLSGELVTGANACDH
jgi:predicted Fe-Mo cluster-binding NifX family protein